MHARVSTYCFALEASSDAEGNEDLDDEFWSAKHTKEAEFNKNKVLKKQVQAMENKLLLDEEQDEAFKGAAADVLQRRDKRDKERVRAEATAELRSAKPEPIALQGKGVFVADRAPGGKIRDAGLHEAILRHGVVLQTTRSDSEVFI